MSIIAASCILGLSQLLLTIFWLLRRRLRSVAECVFFGFLISAAAYLFAGTNDWPIWFNRVLSTLYTGAAGFFYLSCSALFNDDFRLTKWQLAVVAATILMPLSYQVLGLGVSMWRFVLQELPQYLEYILILLGLITTAVYWRDDLVEERRLARAGTLVLVGFYLLGAVGGQTFFGYNEWWVDSGSYIIASAITIVLNLYIGGLRDNTLFVEAKLASPVLPIDESDDLTAKLKQIMEAGVYRQSGLTIGNLANDLGIQEHKLRRLINQQLGYRNFNNFLNSYRIAEAANMLEDQDLPIVDIALDSGFGSLTSFNHAFKQTYGIPPSQYRKKLDET